MLWGSFFDFKSELVCPTAVFVQTTALSFERVGEEPLQGWFSNLFLQATFSISFPLLYSGPCDNRVWLIWGYQQMTPFPPPFKPEVDLRILTETEVTSH